MLTDEDIAKLTSTLATKEDIKTLTAKFAVTEENVRDLGGEVQGLRESIQMLTVSVDGLSKSIDDLKIEYAAVTVKLQRHEKWIQKIAEKIGVGLDY